MTEYVCLYGSSVVIARSLGVEENGIYAGLVSLMQAMLVASAMGADVTLNRHIPQLIGDEAAPVVRSLLWRILAARLGLLAAVGGIGIVLAAFIAHPLASSLTEYGLVLLCFAAIRATTQLIGIALVASFRPAANAVVAASIRILELLLLLILSARGLSIDLVLRLLISTGILQSILLLYFGRDVVAGTWGKVAIGPVLAFGLVYWINSVVDFFLGRFGDLLFLSILLPERTSASLYDVGSSLNQAALLLATAGFAGVSFARMASLAASRPEGMNGFYSTLVRAISLLTIPLFAFLLFHGERVIALLYSSSYSGAGSVLQILVGFRMGSRLFAGGENGEYLLAKGKVVPLVVIGLVAAGANIGLDLLLIPFLRAQGAALASGAANLLVNGLGWRLVKKEGGPPLQIPFWSQAVGICCSSAWIAGLLLGESLPLLVGGYVGFCLFAAWLVKPLRHDDVKALESLHPVFGHAVTHFVKRDGK